MPALGGAALILYKAGVAALTGGVQGPVQEILVPGIGAGDAGVQAAAGLGTAVRGVLHGQQCKGVLRAALGLPLVQHGLGGLLRGGILLLGGVAAGADQDVTDVRGAGLVPGTAVELDHIVVVDKAVAAVILRQSDVSRLTGSVIQPVGVLGASEIGAHGGDMSGRVVDLVPILLGQSLGVGAGGQLGLKLLGQRQGVGLGGLKLGGLLFVGLLHEVALLVGLLLYRGLDGEHGVAEGVQLVGVLRVIGVDLLVRVGQAVLMALLIGGGEHPVGGDAAEGVLIHKGAVVGLEIALQIGVITAGPPGAVQGV